MRRRCRNCWRQRWRDVDAGRRHGLGGGRRRPRGARCCTRRGLRRGARTRLRRCGSNGLHSCQHGKHLFLAAAVFHAEFMPAALTYESLVRQGFDQGKQNAEGESLGQSARVVQVKLARTRSTAYRQARLGLATAATLRTPAGKSGILRAHDEWKCRLVWGRVSRAHTVIPSMPYCARK